MPWLELTLRVPREAVAQAEVALEDLGALAVTLEDDADHPVLEPEPGSTPLWPVVHLRGLFDARVNRAAAVAAMQAVAGVDRPDHVHWREVEDRDWARAWMERFEPMRFGRRLWIVPGGMDIPPDPGNVEIHLDPGLAFGTGTHPTTALCLQWLDAHDVSASRMVDYGCGSGVLGIAAALLGAVRVVCVDNDPQALEATTTNAERNGVGGRVSCCRPDAFAESAADVVLANILAAPLIGLAPVLAGCARPGAPIVLSGILEEQASEVITAYQPFCRLAGQASLDSWTRLDLTRW